MSIDTEIRTNEDFISQQSDTLIPPTRTFYVYIKKLVNTQGKTKKFIHSGI